eukprot:CAMPEP_0197850248 /NCGR_PEP_ID=MMETSP1438-20131217/14758_1 /TAXON_ID=1461541 /ORGANISM="Pterosperma sp., Strain CCMP1384" /LENGTH=211 /DNA_ID=CAMNT_0043463307 /DNA_START=206 /DNA_END=838 /DNA_ORIENTATION=+
MRTTSTPAVYLLWIVVANLIACSSAAINRETAFIGYSEKFPQSTVASNNREHEHSDCVDVNSNCESWAAGGECERNKGFMEGSCPMVCGVCEKQKIDAEKSKQYLEGTPELLTLSTEAGDIVIRLRADLAPKTVAQVKEAIEKSQCSSAARGFYRSEDIPAPGAVDNYGGPGPPYALLQGGLPSMQWRKSPMEKAPVVERGMVAMIQGGPD